MPDALIRLDGVTKTYPGSRRPAVSDLDLDILSGEILILIGPSGCGKSTTLRLINRMIEPTSGRIIFDGDDVTDVNPDHLRRRIGYVIQQVGLFPHRTIKENIATVPRLLGWNSARITSRVDELLEMVGMDPSVYRDRYPKELSGGQAQRVGVARALGADPEVLLMDEPFGAIDPITRDRLQNEFLRLQGELQKTIVFVTHDIDEAIKMGDRIAILKEQSVVVQHDTPEAILAAPANDFVADFLGSGATLKSLSLIKVGDVQTDDAVRVYKHNSRDEMQTILADSERQWLLLLDENDAPVRWVNEEAIDAVDRPLTESGLPVRSIVEPEDTLHSALEAMLHSSVGTACVVGPGGRYVGLLRIESLIDIVRSTEQAAQDRQKTMT